MKVIVQKIFATMLVLTLVISFVLWNENANKSVNVSAAEVSTVKVMDQTAPYTGQPVAFTSVLVTGSNGAVTVSYYKDELCTEVVPANQVIDIGTYYVKASVEGNEKYLAAQSDVAKLTIEKGITKIVLEDQIVPYTGEAIQMAAPTVIGSKGNVTLTYYEDNGCTIPVTSVVDSGDYYVKATVEEDEYFKGATSAFALLYVEPEEQKITTIKNKTLKASKLKKKGTSFKLKAKTSGDGKLSFALTEYPSQCKHFVQVNKKGVVTIKKKIKKGTYVIRISVSGTARCEENEKEYVIKVK